MPTALVVCLSCVPSWWMLLTHPWNLAQSPPRFQMASVLPVLKKPGSDQEDLSNYCPISNLPFLSKILERAVAAQFHRHMSNHELHEPVQSGFGVHHSTETALTAADSSHISILILLDLSAAVDTIFHTILLNCISYHLGIAGTALSRLQSYLSNRKHSVTISKSSSCQVPVNQGVPQGSVPGPVLFTIYMLSLGQIIANMVSVFTLMPNHPPSTPHVS